jgi:hypothetical protein
MAINYGSHSITTDNKITSGAIDIVLMEIGIQLVIGI